jgi:hypothetical protein
MMQVSDQQPRRPIWEIVVEDVERRRDAGVYGASPVVDLVIAAMRARGLVGVVNDRDHLVEAFKQQLDACVYLAAELDEHGVGPSTLITIGLVPDIKSRMHLMSIQQLFAEQVRMAISLRAQIKEHAS